MVSWIVSFVPGTKPHMVPSDTRRWSSPGAQAPWPPPFDLGFFLARFTSKSTNITNILVSFASKFTNILEFISKFTNILVNLLVIDRFICTILPWNNLT